MPRYAVLGNPIKHSLSPKIHQLFAQQFDHQLQYDAIELPMDNFNASVTKLIEAGLKGANVTVPFKEQALNLADQQTQRATLAGAANTRVFKNGETLADNTDGAGLVHDLQRLFGSLDGKRLLLIGAGGATRGVVLPLFNAGVGHITLVNRTKPKAVALVSQFNSYGDISIMDIDTVPRESFDIIVNCTSSSLHGELPKVCAEIFDGASLVYDMFYQNEPTVFMVFAQQFNPKLKAADGIGMLVGQAAESYNIWWGVQPDIQRVIDTLQS